MISYRKIKTHCAEPFTEYWTCIDYTNLQELRRCRKQQAVFDNCVLEKLGWVRPDLGDLSKVTSHLPDGKVTFFSPFLWAFHPDQGANFSQPEGDSWTQHRTLVDFTRSQDFVSVLPKTCVFLRQCLSFAFPSTETFPLAVKFTHIGTIVCLREKCPSLPPF